MKKLSFIQRNDRRHWVGEWSQCLLLEGDRGWFFTGSVMRMTQKCAKQSFEVRERPGDTRVRCASGLARL